jgi:quercetin dioxygenase-like cupin family protein
MPTSQVRTRVLLRSEQTNDQLSVVQNVLPPGFGPPLHHHDFDETFYVLEGELTFQLRDELFTRKRGELAFAPRNVPHTFANLSGADARTLIICTPAGFERYFARMAAERRGTNPPEWALQPIPEVTTVGPRIDPGRT